MPGTVSQVISDGQLEVLLQAIRIGQMEIEEARHDVQKKSVLGADLRGLVRHGLEIPNLLRRHWEGVLDLVGARQIENYFKTGQELKKSFDRGMGLLKEIEQLVRSFEAVGDSVASVSQLHDALEEIRRREEEFRQFEENVLQHWPCFSTQAVMDARTENERGESLDLEEAFAKIAGMDRDTWIERVVNHRYKSA